MLTSNNLLEMSGLLAVMIINDINSKSGLYTTAIISKHNHDNINYHNHNE